MFDAWNRQTHYAVLIHKSSAKTESLYNEKSSLKIESRLTDGIDSTY